jgi:hypothetical protein
LNAQSLFFNTDSADVLVVVLKTDSKRTAPLLVQLALASPLEFIASVT